MSFSVVLLEKNVVELTIRMELGGSMIDMEDTIQDITNKAGSALTKESLEYLDTDGSSIVQGDTVWYCKGKFPKTYHSPYGTVAVERYRYQRTGGGKTWCPLEERARIIQSSTPRFARQVSSKIAQCSPRSVQRDLVENHGRKVSVILLQRVSEAVAAFVQAKDEDWDYRVPLLDAPVKTIAISLDGTCMLMCEKGWREAMAGSLSLYDAAGNRMHTIYLGATPEYGKHDFLKRLTQKISELKKNYPDANYVGIADGAKMNWDFLEQHTQTQILDFYHATGYLGVVAKAKFQGSKSRQSQWLTEKCHALKHEKNAANTLYKDMIQIAKNSTGLSDDLRKKLSEAVTYFKNHKHQMDYSSYAENNYPIGSGVIEAACKTLIKQRLCQSGMRWKDKGAAAILSLRALTLTPSYWQQFWHKTNQYGLAIPHK